MPISTLKKRSEFLRVRGGRRWSTAAFVMECKVRSASMISKCDNADCGKTCVPGSASSADQCAGHQCSGRCSGARFGFTVTKKMGNAVVRNRIRRRLKALVSELAPEFADPNADYVLLARRPALDCKFSDIKDAMRTAFKRLNHPDAGSDGRNDNRAQRRRRRKARTAPNPDTEVSSVIHF